MFSFLFDLHKIDDMNLAFGWVMNFLKLNGIEYMPLIFEFLFDTLGLFSWIFVALTFYSAMIGYSKQMSHFFFLLEHSLGKKLASPYKWSFIFGGLWAGTHVCAFWLAIIGIYLFNNAVMLALMSFLTGIAILIVVGFLAYTVPRRRRAKKEALQREPVRAAPVAPATALPKSEKREKIAGPEVLKITGRKTAPPPPPGTDAEFERALQVLGLKRGFSAAELKKKYRVLAKKVHADTGGSDVLYLQVKKAYEYLLNRAS
jgi:hypothetical protein